jgi:hypothetical protein
MVMYISGGAAQVGVGDGGFRRGAWAKLKLSHKSPDGSPFASAGAPHEATLNNLRQNLTMLACEFKE